MSIAILDRTVAPTSVGEFLKRNDAEATFVKINALVRECYPQLLGIEVGLRDDPDEEDRQKVMLYVSLPDLSLDALMSLKDSYHERLVREIPLGQIPFFGVLLRFVG